MYCTDSWVLRLFLIGYQATNNEVTWEERRPYLEIQAKVDNFIFHNFILRPHYHVCWLLYVMGLKCTRTLLVPYLPHLMMILIYVFCVKHYVYE